MFLKNMQTSGGRRILSTGLATLALTAGTLAVAAPAQAFDGRGRPVFQGGGFGHGGYHRGGGYGRGLAYGLGGLGLGLAAGSVYGAYAAPRYGYGYASPGYGYGYGAPSYGYGAYGG